MRFVIAFDSKRFEANDSTFPGAGLAGVWTKADSVTYFDDLKVRRREERGSRVRQAFASPRGL